MCFKLSWHKRTRVFSEVLTALMLCILSFYTFNVRAFNRTTDQADLYFNKGKQCWDLGKADSAFSYYFKAADLYKKTNNQKQYTISVIRLADYFSYTSNLVKAKANLDIAEKNLLSFYNNDSKLYTEFYLTKGYFLLLSGEYVQSINCINFSIQKSKSSKQFVDTLFIKHYNYIGFDYYCLGDFEKALSLYFNCLKLSFLKNEKPISFIAESYFEIGAVYESLSEYDKALMFYKKTEPFVAQNKNIFKKQAAIFYEYYGLLFFKLGRSDQAILYFNKAFNIYNKNPTENLYSICSIYNNLAIILKNQGDLDKAQSYYQQALDLLTKSDNPLHIDPLSRLYTNMAILYTEKDDTLKAKEFFNKSIALKKEHFPSNLGTTYNSYAEYLVKCGDYKAARNYYQLAENNYTQYVGAQHPDLGLVYLNMGKLETIEGRDEQGMEYYDKALTIFKKSYGDKHPALSECYAAIGDYQLKKGKIKDAISEYQLAMMAVCDGFNNKNPKTNPSYNHSLSDRHLLMAMKKKAAAYNQLYAQQTHQAADKEIAYNTYCSTITLIEKIRNSYLSDESKICLNQNESNTFPAALATALDLYKITGREMYKEKAFEFAEKGKSAALLASMRDVRAMQFAGVPTKLQEADNELKQETAAYDELLVKEKGCAAPDRKKIQRWEEKLFQMNRNRENLIAYMEKTYPDYYKLKYDHSVANVKAIQSTINDDDVVVEYCMADSLVYCFVIGKSTFDYYSITAGKEFDRQLAAFRKNISSQDNTSGNDAVNVGSEGWYLYNKLLKPAEKYICDKDIIIIGDDRLGYIPFETLITRPVTNDVATFARLPYLIEKNAVNYSYSASLLCNTHINELMQDNSLLAFAPSYERIDKNNDSDNNSNLRSGLKPLPGVKDEVNAISNIFSGKVFQSSEATETNFKSESSSYDILHLAMHTIIDEKDPMNSKLVFSQGNNNRDDDMLNTYEIYNMKFKSRMAVLSACNTGNGKLVKGEGIMSMARAFIYAGCPSVVMTLWEVEDKSGVELMSSFYKYLHEGRDKDHALQQAKIDYIKSADPLKAHPYFWSAYVSIGDQQAIVPGQSSKPQYAYLILFVLAIPPLAFYLRKRKVKTRKQQHALERL